MAAPDMARPRFPQSLAHAAIGSMNTDLRRIIANVVEAPVLLVACDFDGTLAPLVHDPSSAAASPAAVAALRRLASLPHTHTAVISGRGLADLRSRIDLGPKSHLAGSHGAEPDFCSPPPMPEPVIEALRLAADRLRTIALNVRGALVEVKPRSVAFHYRAVSDRDTGAAVAAASSLAPELPLLTLRLGHMVLEFVADRTTKADALRQLKRRCGASSVVFVGDDLTDEHAFAILGPGDAGVKVSSGDTRAAYRVAGIEEVARLLEQLAEARSSWLAARRLPPIQAHAILSDQRTIALVNPVGCINWLCLPRIDSPALFAELLGGPAAGRFEITPIDEPPAAPAQQYDADSLILRTRWPNCTITDYLDCAGGRGFQRAGRSDLVRAVEGSARIRIVFAPRLDFGRVATRLVARDPVVEIEGAGDPVVLYAPGVQWVITPDGRHQTAIAEVDLRAGPVCLELRYGSASPKPHPRAESMRRADSHRFWSAWTGSLQVPPVQADLVRRSALALRALCHGPSGAIAAAGTTSLPEHLGGGRNWDYRFCWPRDAALAAAALLRLGNTGTAMRLLDWLLAVVDRCESPDRLRPIYTVTGGDLGPEAEIGDLPGYGGSVPVRIGNAAAQQVQLDVFGPIVDLVAMLAERGAPISPDHWRLTRAMVSAVEARWHEPDHGIWEIRGPRRHHVHSKTMCFQTVDRALVVHEAVIGRPNEAWALLREQIRADVLTHGYSEQARAFVAHYGSTDLDAASLQVGLAGLVDSSDQRWTGTVEAVHAGLRRGPVVDRYRYDDELPGREGGFVICAGWLVEALLTIGRRAEALDLFNQMSSLAGPTGLLAEQFDPDQRTALGNFPQAYSHLALINAAVALHASDPESHKRSGAHA